MQYSTYLALFATAVLAVPLNINLGAYSPALVVGDGEISFGGAEEATPATAAAATGTAAAGTAAKAESISTSDSTTAAQLAALGGVTSTEAAIPVTGMGKSAVSPIVKRALKKSNEALAKRQTANFSAALAYASAALKTSPEVQLGTGEGGSGVGITQLAGGATSTTTTAAKAARDVEEEKKSGPTVTLLKIRTLGDSTAAKMMRDGETFAVKRGVEVDEDGNVEINMDGAIEMTIAEVKA